MSSTEATNSWVQLCVFYKEIEGGLETKQIRHVSKGIGAVNKAANNWQDP
jgi:hypothetical protein